MASLFVEFVDNEKEVEEGVCESEEGKDDNVRRYIMGCGRIRDNGDVDIDCGKI